MEIDDAIRHRQLLSFTYKGTKRVIEPHTYGVDHKDHETVCGFQVAGDSKSGEPIGWKQFRVADMKKMAILPEKFVGTRPKYRNGDRAFSIILAEL